MDQRPLGVDANLTLDVKSWIWTLAGTYQLTTTPDYTLAALGGARCIDLSQTLSWSLSADIPQLPSRNGSGSADLTNWDAMIGVKGFAFLGPERKWFVPYYLDIGTGESKFTWLLDAPMHDTEGLALRFGGLGCKFADVGQCQFEARARQGFEVARALQRANHGDHHAPPPSIRWRSP